MKNVPKVSKEYKVHHARKGSFVGVCLYADPEWATFSITAGTAKFISEEDRVGGDSVSVNLSLCRLEEVNP